MSEEEEMFMINDDVSFGPSDFGKSIRMERKPGAAGDRFRELLLKTVGRIYGLDRQGARDLLARRAKERERLRLVEQEEEERQRQKAEAARERFMARHRARQALGRGGAV